MFHKSPHPVHSHRRAYLFLITAVVGALLVLMIIKDDGSINPLTGSSIGIGSEVDPLNSGLGNSAAKNRGDKTDFSVSFDRAPHLKEETQFSELSFTFKDPSAKIKVNSEELELKNINEIRMMVSNFEGKVDFNEAILSLQGKAESITINGMEISTKGKMDLSFTGLVYEQLSIFDVSVSSLDFGEGSGSFYAGEKMTYSLEHDQLKITGFIGDITIGISNQSLVTVDGQITGLVVKGAVNLVLG